MNSHSLLVAGIGNIFFGDDAFGCEVARELLRYRIPDGVEIHDFGIRGYDLAYALMDQRDAILIDAVPRGGAPGTLYLIEPDLASLDREAAAAPDGHSMNPVSVLRLVRSLGGEMGQLVIVGCEPSLLECEDREMGLTAPVQAAVPKAVDMVHRLIDDYLQKKNFHQNANRPELVGSAKEVN